MHRKALVKAGDTVLLQLGRLAGLRMYAVASKGKHAVLAEHGATPIDYRSPDFGRVIREAEPDGLDAVLDGMMRLEMMRTALSLLRR
ncbi:MAG: hypothetical protein GVY29_05275 [Spirochaetes bacterium]|jgi:NADPH2:quinone reductase|nr:hypothetical protein [Spirochaetota bacterium]